MTLNDRIAKMEAEVNRLPYNQRLKHAWYSLKSVMLAELGIKDEQRLKEKK